VLTNVPEGTQLYKFDAVNQRWLVNQFQFGAWVLAEQTLAPGEGAFIRNPSNPFSITFTGVPSTNFVVSVRSGNNLLSLTMDGTSQLSPRDNDLLRLWDSTQTNYSPVLIASEGIWYSPFTGLPQDPALRAGESFLYFTSPTAGETVPQVRPSVYLNNYAPASGLDAPIASTYGCFGSTWVAQLYRGFGDPGSVNSTNYKPLGVPVPLLASAGATYVDPQLVDVPIAIDTPSSLQIRVWDSRRGSTFEAVVRGTGSFGWSKVFDVTPGPPLEPPVNVVGLSPFTIGPITTFWNYYPFPTNAVVLEGQSAQFELGLTADGDLFSYQWQKETAPNIWTDIPGATSSILVIPSVQLPDAGRYRAVSTFDCAGGVTLPSVLTMFGQPRVEAGITLVGNQSILLSGIVPTGLSFQLEESYDLSHWTNFAAFTSPPESWSVLVTNVPEFSRRFFRVRSAP